MRRPFEGRLSPVSPAGPETAIQALNFLAADETRLERFLSVTGLGPHNLRDAARDPGFFAAVLDHLMADEALLVAFAAEAGLTPEAVARARQSLGRTSAMDDP